MVKDKSKTLLNVLEHVTFPSWNQQCQNLYFNFAILFKFLWGKPENMCSNKHVSQHKFPTFTKIKIKMKWKWKKKKKTQYWQMEKIGERQVLEIYISI